MYTSRSRIISYSLWSFSRLFTRLLPQETTSLYDSREQYCIIMTLIPKQFEMTVKFFNEFIIFLIICIHILQFYLYLNFIMKNKLNINRKLLFWSSKVAMYKFLILETDHRLNNFISHSFFFYILIRRLFMSASTIWSVYNNMRS